MQMIRNSTRAVSLLALLWAIPLALGAQEAGEGALPNAAEDPGAAGPGAREEAADESHVYFEMGFSYWLQGRTPLARRNFERALEAGGEHADRNRIALVRLIGREKRPAGAGRLAEVRAILGAIQQPDLVGTAWLAAMEALYDYGERDAALELSLEMPRRFPTSPEADEAVLFAARILFERQRRAAALDQLFFLIRDYPQSDHLDEAHYLLARVFLEPGIYYSPVRARTALEPFVAEMGDVREIFQNSLWRGSALRLFATLSP